MKKFTTRILSMLLVALLVCTMLPTTALAWSPSDKITIKVQVFSPQKGITYVGTDTVTKGDPETIQSNPYTIPELSSFDSSLTYGRVQKVTGNWYATYTNGANVGTSVNFSCNNNQATITYWVDWLGSASSSGSNTNDGTINEGTGGRWSWQQTVVYHSNYPDGTDYTHTVTWVVQSYSDTYNVAHKTYDECGFTVPTGYTLVTPKYWNTKADGSGTYYGAGGYGSNKLLYANRNTTLHLYAQYEGEELEDTLDRLDLISLKHYNGDQLLSTEVLDGNTDGYVLPRLDEQDGCPFLGWSTVVNATEPDPSYAPDTYVAVPKDTTLYAVWGPHEHYDNDDNGYCDYDNVCMHEKDDKGLCTVDGCQHPHEGDGACCPKDFICWNMQTGVKYDDVTDALEAAVSGQTVQMLKNATAADNGKNEIAITVDEGKTFDLNGFMVETGFLSSSGNVVDNNTTTDGGLISPSSTVSLTANNLHMPLYDADAGCYRFYQYKFEYYKNQIGDDYVNYGYTIRFDKLSAYQVMSDHGGDTGLSVDHFCHWTALAENEMEFNYTPENINKFGASGLTAVPAGKTPVFTFKLSNLSVISGQTLNSRMEIYSVTGVKAEAKAEPSYEVS